MKFEDVQRRVGSRIRELRRARGQSIEALAAAAEMGATFLGEIERGLQNPSLATLVKIANALELDLTAVIDVRHSLDRAALRRLLVDRASRASEDDLRLALRVLDIVESGGGGASPKKRRHRGP